jgi:cytosine/adenosine deaminase-related metal-dependent hydrolase
VAFAVGYADQNNLVYAPDKDFIASLPADLTSEIKNHLTSSPPPTLVEYEGLFDRTFHWLKGKAPSRMRLLAGPLSPIWCSPEALEMTGEICKRHDTGLHTHLLESIYQRHYAKTILGKSMVSYLASLSLLGPLSSFAHGVWVSRNDIGLLGESGSTIVHNPSSNLRLRNGIAPVIPMLREGVSVALGQDATSLDDDDDVLKVVQLLYKGGASASLWGTQVGSLLPGAKADMVGISLERVPLTRCTSPADRLTTVLQRLRSTDVRWVMVDGKEVIRDGHSVSCDEDELRGMLMQQVQTSAARSAGTITLADRLRPHVRGFYARQAIDVDDSFSKYNAV